MSQPYDVFPNKFFHPPSLDDALPADPQEIGPPEAYPQGDKITLEDLIGRIIEYTKAAKQIVASYPESGDTLLKPPAPSGQKQSYVSKQNLTGAAPDRYLSSSAVEQIIQPPSLSEPLNEIEHPAEIRLTQSFAALLGRVSFQEVLVPMRKSKPVVNADKFRFAPIVDSIGHQSSYQVQVPAGIRTTYKEKDGLPYLDTPRAIGLVYRDWLVAVGGAQVNLDGQLIVRQLQDVTNVRKATEPEIFAQTGLRNGFWWRDTLVKAWERIGSQLGVAEVVIQSNQKSTWSQVRKAGGRGYDDVARRMHFGWDEATENWMKTLRPTD